MYSELEDTIKLSFRRVKEHMERIEQEISSNKEQILALQEEIKGLVKRFELITTAQETSPVSQQVVELPPKNEISIGSDRVLINKQINKQIDKQINKHSLNTPLEYLDLDWIIKNLPSILQRLSRQEFLTLLAIYQQEEEQGRATYDSVANALSISPNCVRTYVWSLIKKDFPILKVKQNNNLVLLSIPLEFRRVTPKGYLMRLFYSQDLTQKKLSEGF